MDNYTLDEVQYKNGFDAGYKQGWETGWEEGNEHASARNHPESPYDDDDVLSCPCCGSVEYLHNEDGNLNKFCGQCGQALDWEGKR